MVITPDSAIHFANCMSDRASRQSCEDVRDFAAGLLSQQIWCWGQDIRRPEGNWLLRLGFERTTPPKKQESCASMYRLELPPERRIVLRGFGVFLGDDRRGGMFLERYGFSPKFTDQSRLIADLWSCEDLPPLRTPESELEVASCRLMLLSLIDWIVEYELRVRQELGNQYRAETLERWNNGKRFYLPESYMMSAWRQLSLRIGAGTFCLEAEANHE